MGSHHISQNIFDNNCLLLNLVSYNLHGINQGFSAIRDIIASHNPDIFLLQEHWLTPDNLSTFSRLFPDYFHYGTSAMSSDVSRGVLRGRPYGGVSFLISNKLIAIITCIASCERYAIIKVNNCLIINVYLPCSGTANRDIILSDVLSKIWLLREQYLDCYCILAGDFNVNLDDKYCNQVSLAIKQFIVFHHLSRCDCALDFLVKFTYCNEAQGHYSKLDY